MSKGRSPKKEKKKLKKKKVVSYITKNFGDVIKRLSNQ